MQFSWYLSQSRQIPSGSARLDWLDFDSFRSKFSDAFSLTDNNSLLLHESPALENGRPTGKSAMKTFDLLHLLVVMLIKIL